MNCKELITDDSKCCSTRIVPTEFEQIFSDYYACAAKQINKSLNIWYSGEVYGDTDKAIKASIQMIDIHALFAYLTLIYLDVLEDQSKNPCKVSQPVKVYYDANKLACIRRFFTCKEVDITNLLNAFGLTDPLQKQLFDGINFMSIEVVNPDDPNCTQDDQLFIVSKP